MFYRRTILSIGIGLLSAQGFAAPSAPVSLEKAYRAALEKSEVVRQTAEQVEQADYRIDQIRGGIFPNITFNISHQIQPAFSDPNYNAFSPQNQTTANFNVTQPIFKGLREWSGLAQYRHLRTSEEARQDGVLNKLYQEVAANYLQVLNLEQDLVNLRDQNDLYNKRVDELGARAKRGESNQSDVVSAQSTQASLIAETKLVEGQLEVARETFAFLTGMPRESGLTDPDKMKSAKLDALDAYMKQVENRPDVRSAKERYEAADENVSVAWGGHFPSIDAYGNYYLVRPGFLSDLKWDIGVKVTFPIFEGLATQSKIKTAVSQRKEAELELEKTRRAARQEVRSIFERLKARIDHLSSLKKSAELSKRNTVLMQQDYRRGLARNIDVQLALTEYRMAQRGFDQAHFTTQLELIQLQAAAAMLPKIQKD